LARKGAGGSPPGGGRNAPGGEPARACADETGAYRAADFFTCLAARFCLADFSGAFFVCFFVFFVLDIGSFTVGPGRAEMPGSTRGERERRSGEPPGAAAAAICT